MGEVLSLLKDGTHGTHPNTKAGPMLLSAKNIKDGKLHIKAGEERRISWKDFESIHSSFVLKKNDVLMTIVGTIGEATILKDPTGITFQRSVAYLRPKDALLPYFLIAEIATPSFQQQLDERKSISAQPGVYLGDVKNIDVAIPETNEQERIASFFNTLNNLIAAHERKLELLKKKKQYYLQAIFNQMLRFKGFTEPWKQCKLGDCFSERNERSADGELLSVTIDKGIKKFSDLNRRDNSSEDKSRYKQVKIGDIAYNSMRMWQGASGYSSYAGIVSPAYTVIVPEEEISPSFFSYMFKWAPMMHIFQINSQGLTSDTWNLKFPRFSEIVIKVPCRGEQDEISRTFDLLDDIITNYEDKLNLLKKKKQYYLQELFI